MKRNTKKNSIVTNLNMLLHILIQVQILKIITRSDFKSFFIFESLANYQISYYISQNDLIFWLDCIYFYFQISRKCNRENGEIPFLVKEIYRCLDKFRILLKSRNESGFVLLFRVMLNVWTDFDIYSFFPKKNHPL